MESNSLDLTLELVKTSFKMRYQNSLLGFLWVLIKPYLTFFVLYLIFSNITKSNVENYSLYLLSGVIFITFINELVVLGQMSLLERSNIILKVNFSRQIAIISALIGSLINLLINLLLLIFLIVVSAKIAITLTGILYLILIVIITFGLFLGLAFFSSLLTIWFRDLKNIFELGLFLLQYASPIFYSLEDTFIPEDIRKVIALNPISILMNQFRASLEIYGKIDVDGVFVIFIVATILLVLGWIYFSKNVKKIAEYF